LIADQDRNSKKDDETWRSWLKTGTLKLSIRQRNKVSIKWDDEMTELTTHISEKLRGAELSELIVYNNKLYTVEDKSGIGTYNSFGRQL
jgi:soluble calcium-activated nucleotidase 1